MGLRSSQQGEGKLAVCFHLAQHNIKIDFMQNILLPQMPYRVYSRLSYFLSSGVCGFTVEISMWPQRRRNRHSSKGNSLHLCGIPPLKQSTLVGTPITEGGNHRDYGGMTQKRTQSPAGAQAGSEATSLTPESSASRTSPYCF